MPPEPERAALGKIDVYALAREVTGETIEEQLKKTVDTAATLFRKVCGLRRELRRWQRFAAYCRSCALSGETNPMDFDSFYEMPANQDVKRTP